MYNYYIWKYIKKEFLNTTDSVEKVEIGAGNTNMLRKLTFTLSGRFVDLREYDVVHIPSPIMDLSVPRHRRGRLISTLHEFFILDESKPMPASRATSIASLIGDSIKRQTLTSDFLLPNSIQTMDEAILLDYPKEKMAVVPHAIEDQFLSGTPFGRHKLHTTFRVGYLGSMHDRKNVKSAIFSFKMYRNKSACFDIWGKPSDEVSRISIGDSRIRLRGFAPEKSKRRIYEGFDAFVFPSRYEGFGKEILEAQACGVPVIVFKKARISKEIKRFAYEAEDERDMADILDSICENGYPEKTRLAAMKYARTFSWERCAKDTITAYRHLIEIS